MRIDTLKACVRRAVMSATLIIPLSAFSCDLARDTQKDNDPSQRGKLALAVELADHSEVSKVQYVIKLEGDKIRDGKMQINDGGVASATEVNLLASDGYTVDLTAARKFIQPCTGVTDFVVKAGTTTTVPVIFQCDSSEPENEAP